MQRFYICHGDRPGNRFISENLSEFFHGSSVAHQIIEFDPAGTRRELPAATIPDRSECLELVCVKPERAFEIAESAMALSDDPRLRFGRYQNILELVKRSS